SADRASVLTRRYAANACAGGDEAVDGRTDWTDGSTDKRLELLRAERDERKLRNRAEGIVGRHQRIRLAVQRDRGENRVEGAERLVTLEELEAGAHVLRRDLDERAQQLDVGAGQPHGLSPGPPASVNVRELLDHLGRRREARRARRRMVDDPPARLAQPMVGADRVAENGRVQKDHRAPLRMRSSSRFSSSTLPTSTGSAVRISRAAARRRPPSVGIALSIASRTAAPTERPCSRA